MPEDNKKRDNDRVSKRSGTRISGGATRTRQERIRIFDEEPHSGDAHKEQKSGGERETPKEERDTRREGDKSARRSEPPRRNTRAAQASGGDPDRFAHQVIPYVMFWVALFAAVSFLLRDVFRLGDTAGAFGNWFADFLCGLLGAAAYLLPFFLVVLAVRWKSFVIKDILPRKLVLSTLFLWLLSAIIHVFSDSARGVRVFEGLYRGGVARTGGGLFGGFLGEWIGSTLYLPGTILLAIPLLIIIGIYLVGLTPSSLWHRISYKVHAAAQARRERQAELYGGKEDRKRGTEEKKEVEPYREQQARKVQWREPQGREKSEPEAYEFRETDEEPIPFAKPARRTRPEESPSRRESAPKPDIVDIPDDEPLTEPLSEQHDVHTILTGAGRHTDAQQDLNAMLSDVLERSRAETAPTPEPKPAPEPQKAPKSTPEPDYSNVFAPFALPVRPGPRNERTDDRSAGRIVITPHEEETPATPAANTANVTNVNQPYTPAPRPAPAAPVREPEDSPSAVKEEVLGNAPAVPGAYSSYTAYASANSAQERPAPAPAPAEPKQETYGGFSFTASEPVKELTREEPKQEIHSGLLFVADEPLTEPVREEPKQETYSGFSFTASEPVKETTYEEPKQETFSGSSFVSHEPLKKPKQETYSGFTYGTVDPVPEEEDEPPFTPAVEQTKWQQPSAPATPVHAEQERVAPEPFVSHAPATFVSPTPVSPTPVPPTPTVTAHAEPVVSEPAPKPTPPPAPREYRVPPISLLREDTNEKNADHSEEMREKSELLRETLNSFNVRVKEQVDCFRGPTITRYEVRPEIGVSVRSIMNRVDDISLAMAAPVRIDTQVMGKSAIGIEVPNEERETVYMRTMLESEDFRNSNKILEVPIGVDLGGNIQMCNLAKMPHLLIAGTTGSGKSVCINTILIGLLYKNSPADLRLILIDPKQVEFTPYEHIPHLYTPIVIDAKRAVGALACAVQEMERRYALLRDVGVRNIEGYNEITKDDPEREHLPYMVIVIDEFADLMQTAGNDAEKYACRLAAKARAAGIHMIIGTQRPSVDVVTGQLKNNIPSRIAFTVKQQIDSRTILDANGAEALTGRGDMLYAPTGVSRAIRAQGAFMDDEEVERVTMYVREYNDPVQYSKSFMDQLEVEMAKAESGKKRGEDFEDYSGEGGGSPDGEDPKFWEAVKFSIEAGRVSTSLLQRRIGVGYGRAAKIIDRMEERGFVGPADGNKPRQLLITEQQYMEYMMRGDSGDKGGAPDEFSEMGDNDFR